MMENFNEEQARLIAKMLLEEQNRQKLEIKERRKKVYGNMNLAREQLRKEKGWFHYLFNTSLNEIIKRAVEITDKQYKTEEE